MEDAFREWDEATPRLPSPSRTTTLSDPVTTARLAKGSQRITVPRVVPQSLEEALLALADGLLEPSTP